MVSLWVLHTDVVPPPLLLCHMEDVQHILHDVSGTQKCSAAVCWLCGGQDGNWVGFSPGSLEMADLPGPLLDARGGGDLNFCPFPLCLLTLILTFAI